MNNDDMMGNVAWLGCWIIRGFVIWLLYNVIAGAFGLSAVSGAIFVGAWVLLTALFMDNIIEEGRTVSSRWVAFNLLTSGIVALVWFLLERGILA